MRCVRFEPVLIGALFIGSFVLALVAYYGPLGDALFARAPNPDRELIDPPRRLPALTVARVRAPEAPLDPWSRYRWSLIYARIAACDDPCVRHLMRLQQVVAALGRDAERVQRIALLADPAGRPLEDDELLIGALDGATGAELTALFGPERIDGGWVFVADPFGNLVLRYRPDADLRRLLDDLERLF
jgi:hypothetical protein